MSPTTQEAVILGNQKARQTLRAVMSYRRFKNRHLAEQTGMHINTVQGYTGGATQLTAGVMEAFAEALGVDRWVLAMDEADAMRWVLDHAPNEEWQPQNWKVLSSGTASKVAGRDASNGHFGAGDRAA